MLEAKLVRTRYTSPLGKCLTPLALLTAFVAMFLGALQKRWEVSDDRSKPMKGLRPYSCAQSQPHIPPSPPPFKSSSIRQFETHRPLCTLMSSFETGPNRVDAKSPLAEPLFFGTVYHDSHHHTLHLSHHRSLRQVRQRRMSGGYGWPLVSIR